MRQLGDENDSARFDSVNDNTLNHPAEPGDDGTDADDHIADADADNGTDASADAHADADDGQPATCHRAAASRDHPAPTGCASGQRPRRRQLRRTERRRRRQMTAISPSSVVQPGRLVRVSTAATIGAAGLVIWSAIIHLHLWTHGYRNIPDIGRLFLAQGLAGYVVGAAVLIWRRPLTAVAGAAYLAATAAGLILSATVGVFHFHDGLDAPYAGLSVVVQFTGIALFGLAAALERPRRAH